MNWKKWPYWVITLAVFVFIALNALKNPHCEQSYFEGESCGFPLAFYGRGFTGALSDIMWNYRNLVFDLIIYFATSVFVVFVMSWLYGKIKSKKKVESRI